MVGKILLLNAHREDELTNKKPQYSQISANSSLSYGNINESGEDGSRYIETHTVTPVWLRLPWKSLIPGQGELSEPASGA